MTLQEIREAKAAKAAEARSLVAKAEAEKRSLTSEESAAFDRMKAEIIDLETQESRATFLADTERRMSSVPVERGSDSFDRLQAQVSVGDVLRAQVEGRSLSGAAAECHQEIERRTGRKAQGYFVPLSALETRATSTTTAGELIQTDVRGDQFIQPLRNRLLARKLGARVLSGLVGPVSVPRYGTGLSTGWVAEGGALPEADLNPDNVTLSPKHAGGVTEMTRSIIMQSSPDVEQLIRDDLSALLAAAIDKAMIVGGGANEPKGILSAIGIQSGTLAGMTWAQVVAMKAKLLGANVDAANASWLFNAGVGAKFESTVKAANTAEYLMGEDGKIASIPAYVTQQVPDTTGATPKGQAILGDFTEMLLGIWSEIDILVNPYAEAPYRRGGVLVRAMSTVDVAFRHPEAFVVANDVVIP